MIILWQNFILLLHRWKDQTVSFIFHDWITLPPISDNSHPDNYPPDTSSLDYSHPRKFPPAQFSTMTTTPQLTAPPHHHQKMRNCPGWELSKGKLSKWELSRGGGILLRTLSLAPLWHCGENFPLHLHYRYFKAYQYFPIHVAVKLSIFFQIYCTEFVSF